jgi:hypothetical protein
MPRGKGVRPRPPVIMTDPMANIKAQEKVTHKMMSLSKLSSADREYLLGMFEALKSTVEPMIIEGPSPNVTNKYRYTPRQMWENTKKYFEVTIQHGQPLTVSGIAVFNDIEVHELQRPDMKRMDPSFHFLLKCAKFVEMYNEYAAHKKMNPAGPIFILKNFGWKDTFTVDATSTIGALTEEERTEAQKRIADFSETIIKK